MGWKLQGLGPLTVSSSTSNLDFHLSNPQNKGSSAFVCPHCCPQPCARPLTCALLCCVQGQGALSERLRSFSMQDLTTIRGDGAPAPTGPPPPGAGRASGKHGQPKMSRSASESAGSSGRCLFPATHLHLFLAFIERHSTWPLPRDLPLPEMSIRSCQLRGRVSLRPGSWPGDFEVEAPPDCLENWGA